MPLRLRLLGLRVSSLESSPSKSSTTLLKVSWYPLFVSARWMISIMHRVIQREIRVLMSMFLPVQFIKTHSIQDPSSTDRLPSQSCVQSFTFDCPVCLRSWNVLDNADLNRHLDRCLHEVPGGTVSIIPSRAPDASSSGKS
jgi:hypothetical protein